MMLLAHGAIGVGRLGCYIVLRLQIFDVAHIVSLHPSGSRAPGLPTTHPG